MIKLDSDVILSKKVLIPTGIIASIIIIAMIFASIFGSQKEPMEYLFQLNTRATNLSATMQTYNRYISSTSLASSAAALSSNLTAIASSLTETTQSDEYKNLSKSATEGITTSETELITNLNNTLESARLNNNLDKVYAQQMAAQITDLIYIETSARNALSDDSYTALKSSLDRSISNLNALYPNFSNF